MQKRSSDEVYADVEAALTPEYLERTCSPIGFPNEGAKNKFFKRVMHVSKRYAYLIQANPKRLTEGAQTKLLNDYKAALQNVSRLHAAIDADNPTSSRLYSALREEYNKLPILAQKELASHINHNGYTMSVFLKLIDLLTTACDTANEQEGGFKSDLSKEFLVGWLMGIRLLWPDDGHIKFGLGDYLEQLGDYKSASADILYSILSKIDETVERKYLCNLMKRMTEKDEKQVPAIYFFLEEIDLQGMPVVHEY